MSNFMLDYNVRDYNCDPQPNNQCVKLLGLILGNKKNLCLDGELGS